MSFTFAANGIAVDSSGYATLAGSTESSAFPTANALYGSLSGVRDAFAARLNQAGTVLMYSTYLGGNYTDEANGVGLDVFGNVYLTGDTDSTNFPTSSGAYQSTNAGNYDAFLTKIQFSPLPPTITSITTDTG